MGGAYCTMAYAEFLRRHGAGVPSFTQYNIGDLYSLAAPRTCFEPFASQLNALTQREGSGTYAFRIVNHEDPVPKMPPPWPPLANAADYPFIHPAGGWKLGDDGPVKMADEPPPVPPPQSEDEAKANAHYHGALALKVYVLFDPTRDADVAWMGWQAMMSITRLGRRRLTLESSSPTPWP